LPEPAPFAGFPPATFAWFAGLEAENTRDWFAANRDVFDRDVRGAFEALLDELAEEVGGAAKVFRQHRDLRFSPDKSPYKTRTYGVIHDREDGGPVLFAEVSSPGLFGGTGGYRFASDQLERFRAAVADDTAGSELETIVAGVHAAGVETFGEELKVAPRGYPRDHPRVVLLRHKSLIGGARLKPTARGIGRAAALKHLRHTWGACEALNAWLAAHVGPSDLPEDDRGGRGRPRR
jgi:uncharacterized protein (TIGR02453 family)